MGDLLTFKSKPKPPTTDSDSPAMQRALEYLRLLPRETAEALVELLATQLAQEVWDGLFSEDESPQGGNAAPERLFFDKISEMFYEFMSMSRNGCYFCDPNVDPNETPFDGKTTELCPMCRLKLLKVHNWMKGIATSQKRG